LGGVDLLGNVSSIIFIVSIPFMFILDINFLFLVLFLIVFVMNGDTIRN
jgi:hypothetical protein